MNGNDDAAQVVTAKLADGTDIMVQLAKSSSPDGMQSAGFGKLDLDLDDALATVGRVGSAVMGKLKAAAPTRAAVELKFGFELKAGKIVALWVDGKGEASLTVTLEWSKDSTGASSGDEKTDDNGDSDA